MITSFIKRAAVVALAIGAIGGFAAGSASAVVRDVDTPRISGGQADFGSGLHIAGAPIGKGKLTWDQGLAAPGVPSIITAKLTGTVYFDKFSLFSGGCARVVLKLYATPGSVNTPGPTLGSDKVCRPAGGFSVLPKVVNIPPLKSINADKAVITTQVSTTTSGLGPWTTTGSQTWYYGQINGVVD